MPYLELRFLNNTMRKEDNRLVKIDNWELARAAFKQIEEILLAAQVTDGLEHRKDKEAPLLED